MANDSNKSTFDIITQDFKRAKRFGSAMKAYTEGTGFDLQYVVDNYPWKDFNNGLIVDVFVFTPSKYASNSSRLVALKVLRAPNSRKISQH